MTGKEIILKAMRGEETVRPAWLPFVGCHGGKLISKTATEYLQSSDLLVEGLLRANELYRPDGLPIVFDLQVEAEILGCDLQWADEVPPSVISHPLTTSKIDDLPTLDETKGRFPLILAAMDRLIKEIGNDIALYGLICGPFTLALHLMGNNIFLEMYDEPEKIIELMDFAADICIKSAALYITHGASIIAVVDPMTSQISPDHFHEFVTPSVNKVFDAIKEKGSMSSLFVCGDATRNLEAMCETHTDNVSVDEQIPMNLLGELCRKNNKSFGGNMRLTSVLLLGDELDSKHEAIDIIEKSGTKGFILAPGCDLPYNTPQENLQAVGEIIHDNYQREIAKNTINTKESDTFDDVVPPNYHNYKEVILDVITLDSTSCAPCQYMMDAVKVAAEATFVKVFINEHKIKARRGLGMMSKLGVKNLPTICIDGEVAFSSIIPDQKTLVKAIEKRAIVKNF